MSELTKCNYCNMLYFKKTAANVNKRVVTRPGTGQLGGLDVYVLPSGTTLPEGEIAEGDEFHKKYWVAWLMKLSDHCVC